MKEIAYHFYTPGQRVVRVNDLLPDEKVFCSYHELLCNRKTYYRIAFMGGVNDESIDICMREAKKAIDESVIKIIIKFEFKQMQKEEKKRIITFGSKCNMIFEGY